MPFRFLTDDWFAAYAELIQDVEVPEKFAEIVVNLHVQQEARGSADVHMSGGFLHKGLAPEAMAVITAPEDIIYQGIVLGDLKAALPAVFSGRLKIEGNKAALVRLVSIPQTETQRALVEKLKSMTTM